MKKDDLAFGSRGWPEIFSNEISKPASKHVFAIVPLEKGYPLHKGSTHCASRRGEESRVRESWLKFNNPSGLKPDRGRGFLY